MTGTAHNGPPFRADHVGSLMRPAHLQEARERILGGKNLYENPGAHHDDALRGIEDEAIRDAVKLQEDAGLRSITDGEFRRQTWWTDVVFGFEGPAINPDRSHVTFRDGTGQRRRLPQIEIRDRFRWTESVVADAFRFLRRHTDRTAKLTIPAPLNIYYFAGGRAGIDTSVYPDLQRFWDDVVEAYRREIEALVQAGCRYLQLDEVAVAFMCDPAHRAMVEEWGDDPLTLLATYADVVNRILAGRPDDMRITMHLCRGNLSGEWAAEGGYDPVAEILFNQFEIDGFFLEYDSPRAGLFDPLRFVPKGRMVVLGLITTKSPELEEADDIVRRIHEAGRHLDVEQLALSPQCGFASNYKGNPLTIDDERRKLELVVRIADRVWGGA